MLGQSIKSFVVALNRPLQVKGGIGSLGLVGCKPEYQALRKKLHRVLGFKQTTIFM